MNICSICLTILRTSLVFTIFRVITHYFFSFLSDKAKSIRRINDELNKRITNDKSFFLDQKLKMDGYMQNYINSSKKNLKNTIDKKVALEEMEMLGRVRKKIEEIRSK